MTMVKKTVGKNAKPKKYVKHKTAKKANKENIYEESTEEQNLTQGGIEKVTEWLGRQAQEVDNEEIEKGNNSPQSSIPGTSNKPNTSIPGPSIPGPSKPDRSRNTSPKPDYFNPVPGLTKTGLTKPGAAKPGTSKPGTSKPAPSKPAPHKSNPSKIFQSKTATEAPKSTGPLRQTLGTRPGPVSGRTMDLMAKSLQITKPPAKLMNDEEIAAFLDPLRTPTRKK